MPMFEYVLETGRRPGVACHHCGRVFYGEDEMLMVLNKETCPASDCPSNGRVVLGKQAEWYPFELEGDWYSTVNENPEENRERPLDLSALGWGEPK